MTSEQHQAGGSDSGAGSIVDAVDLSFLSKTEREPFERILRSLDSMATVNVQLRTDLEAARSLLGRLVELGQDDGSASDNAWREAFTDAEAWLHEH